VEKAEERKSVKGTLLKFSRHIIVKTVYKLSKNSRRL